MKKHLQLLWAAMFAAVALPAAAQTAENPQVLVAGENVALEGTTYYTYTATENALLTIEGFYLSSYSEPVTASANGETWKVACFADYGNPKQSAFYVEKDVTYTFSHSESAEMTFTVTLEKVEGSLTGESCSDPMLMPQTGKFLMPVIGDYYESPYVYASYTAPFDGKLRIIASDRLQTLCIGNGCDTEDWMSLEGGYNSVLEGYVYSVVLDKDETVIVRANGSTASMFDIQFVEVIPGATCEDAFEAKVGENTIPAAAGNYFYTVQVPDKPQLCTLKITSDAKASVHFTNGCDNEYNSKDYPSLNISRRVTAYSIYALEVIKTEATAADETFKLEFLDLLPIEDSKKGEPIEADKEYTTPATSEDEEIYYYSFTLPEGDPKMFTLESDAPDLGYNGPFVLNELGVYYPTYGRGANFKCEVAGGKTYLLTVNMPANVENGYTFKFTLGEMLPGQTQTFAIKAQLGDNEVPAFTPVYYSYTSDVDRYVAVKCDIEGAAVKVMYEKWSSMTDMPTTVTDEGAKFECVAGTEYIIEVSNLPENATGKLVITEVPYGPGESAATAIEAEAGTYNLPAGPSKVWYKLVAPQDGFFTLNTTMLGDYSSEIAIYRGEVSQETRTLVTMDYGTYPYGWKEAKLGVTKDEVIYVCFNNSQSQAEATATFAFAEALEGEVSSKPIKLDFTAPETKVTLKAASYEAPVWYSIDLPEGIMSLVSESSISLNLYTPENVTTPMISGGWIEENSYGIGKVMIPQAGTYLIMFDRCNDGTEATISTRQPLPGETPSTAEELTFDVVPYELPLELIGENNSTWYCFDAHEGVLNIVGNEGQYWNAQLFSEKDFNTSIGELRSEMTESSYAYGIRNVELTEAGKYYLYIYTAYEGTKITFSGSAIEPEPEFVNVNVEISDGQTFSYSAANKTVTEFSLVLPENWVVESCELNGEEAAVADKYSVTLNNVDQNFVFTLAYDGEITFVDSTVGMTEIDAKIKIGVVEGKIRIEGTTAGDKISVYNLGGMMVASHDAQNDVVTIELPAGAYVVTVNGSAAKVVL